MLFKILQFLVHRHNFDSVIIDFSPKVLITVYVIPFCILEVNLSQFFFSVVGRLPYAFMNYHEYENDEHF